jgi:acyl dehydratase
VYEGFLRAFDDRSPVHVDAEHARALGFAGRVMHGGILNGFVSHFVGMVFPGAHSLLLSTDLRFQRPNYLNDRLTLRARVAQKLDSHQIIVLHIGVMNETQGLLTASGKVNVKLQA